MSLRRILLAALLCALATPAAFAAGQAGAAPAEKWVLPWKPGTALEYASEELDTEGLGEREVSRTTSNVAVRIRDASGKGFIQAWTWRDFDYEIVEGDKSEEASVGALTTAMEGVTLEVELDAEGTYRQVHDLPAFVTTLRQAFRPVILDQVVRELQATEPDPAMQDAMRHIANAVLDTELDKMLSAAVVEQMFAIDVRWYNAFSGMELVPGQQYKSTPARSMMGVSVPVPMSYLLATRPESPDDLFVTFEQKLDREVGKDVLITTIENQVGEPLSAAQKQQELVVLDQGMFVVHRRTGVVEMFESTRTIQVGDKRNVYRTRMRQLNGEHAHSWDEQVPAAVR